MTDEGTRGSQQRAMLHAGASQSSNDLSSQRSDMLRDKHARRADDMADSRLLSGVHCMRSTVAVVVTEPDRAGEWPVIRTVAGGGQVGDDGEAHEVRQAEVRHDAVAAAGSEWPIPRAVVPVEVRHVLHHRHAGDLLTTLRMGSAVGASADGHRGQRCENLERCAQQRSQVHMIAGLPSARALAVQHVCTAPMLLGNPAHGKSSAR